MGKRLKKTLSVDEDARIKYFLVVDELKKSDQQRGFSQKVKGWIRRIQRQKEKGGAA